MALSTFDRDLVIRTIIGEAGGEKPAGWAGVAHSILNRTNSSRYPNSAGKVVKQYKQYSTWNKGKGGNKGARNARPGVGKYNQIGDVVDQVFDGSLPDPTGGATHYYSPRGMKGGKVPYWWNDEKRRGGGVVKIGGHRFAGNPSGIQTASAAITPPSTNPLDNFKTNISDTPAGRILARMGGDKDAFKGRPIGNLLSMFGSNKAQAGQAPAGLNNPDAQRFRPRGQQPTLPMPAGQQQHPNMIRHGQQPRQYSPPGQVPGGPLQGLEQRFRPMPQSNPFQQQIRRPPPRPQMAQPAPAPRPRPAPPAQGGQSPLAKLFGGSSGQVPDTSARSGMLGIDPMAQMGPSNTLPPGATPSGGMNPLAALFGLFK